MIILKEVYKCERVYMCTMCDGLNNHFHIQLIPRYSYEKRGSNNFVKERHCYIYDAEKYNINLDSLEIKEQQTEKKKKVNLDVEILGNLDISLSEIINIIISSSERPTFIIRDDKLVYINSATPSGN